MKMDEPIKKESKDNIKKESDIIVSQYGSPVSSIYKTPKSRMNDSYNDSSEMLSIQSRIEGQESTLKNNNNVSKRLKFDNDTNMDINTKMETFEIYYKKSTKSIDVERIQVSALNPDDACNHFFNNKSYVFVSLSKM